MFTIDRRHDFGNYHNFITSRIWEQNFFVRRRRSSVTVATKADKLSKNELRKSLKKAEAILANTKIIPFSSQSGNGRDEIWQEIITAINNF
jgi:GTP-binding protein EngB required for normal cell division